MSGRARGAAALVVIAACLGLASLMLYGRDRHYTLPGTAEQLLYLRSGRVADRVMLSFKSVAADVYWIRAIQHYGRERKSLRSTGRFELLQPLLDLTTTLDPRFNIAYRFGAIFLALEPPNGPARPDQAIALLEKGLAANPTRWQYAHDIGFIEYWYGGDRLKAAEWFRKAADMPGAPAWIRPLAATMLAEGGDRTSARAMLREVQGSEERYVRAAATRGLAQLKALDDIDELQRLVGVYQTRTGEYPASLAELAHASGIRGIPADPTGLAYAYDASAHTIELSPGSTLNPLPSTMRAK